MSIDKKLTTYLDRPDVQETFIDTVESISVDNHCLRIELSVTRPDLKKRTNPLSGSRHPACRLVMPVATVPDLYNQLSQIIKVLEKKGTVKKGPQGPVAVQGSSSVQ